MSQQPFPASLKGSFEVIEVLGQGGMGTVWSAKRLSDSQKVAIKVLLPHLHADEIFRSRFSREAAVGQEVKHPGIVPVLDSGVAGDQAYIVSQFVDGQPLDEVLDHYGALEEGAAIDVVLQVSRALGALHKKNIVHRDVKPENIIVQRDGTVKVLDFGLARCLEGGQTVTKTGVVVGTPAFMSPEVCCGRPIDPRTDVFSVGVLFIACLEGRKAVIDTSVSPLAQLKKRAVEKETPKLPARYCQALKRLVGHATAYDPQERFTDCNALVEALDAYRQPRDVENETDKVKKSKEGQETKGSKEEGRNSSWTSMAIPICLCIIFVALIYLCQSGTEPRTRVSQAEFIARRQQLLKKEGKIEIKELKEFSKMLEDRAQEEDLPADLPVEGRALHYLANFLRRSWVEREDDEKRRKLAHRTAEIYLQLFDKYRSLTSSKFSQDLLHDTYDAFDSSWRYDEFLDLLRLLNVDGTIAYARDYYLAKTTFKKAEHFIPPDHEERKVAATGFLEADKLLRPLVERLARGPFNPPLIHIHTKDVLDCYGYLHHFIRMQTAKRQMMNVLRQLVSPGSMLNDEMKVMALVRAHSELLQDNRGRKIDDPYITDQEINDALECIHKAQGLCKDEKVMNELYFLESNAYRRGDRFKEARAALDKVSPKDLYDSTVFEYYIKSGYIYAGLTRYAEACQAFKEAQIHARSDADRNHAKLQWEKARLQKAYDEAQKRR